VCCHRPASFFRASRPLWNWQAVVVDAGGQAPGALYCGVGLHAGVARFRPSRRGGAFGGARRCVEPRRVVEAACEDWAPRELAALEPELVLLNPPRTGCHQSVLDAIRSVRPRSIVYVSCDAATLARDIARLGPDFRVARIIVLDALPQTHHVEVVAVLESV
jgi:hypothetical protein